MAISFVGAATGVTSATLPAHQAGDVIIACGYRDGGSVAPTAPGGWSSIDTGGSSSNFSTAVYFVAVDGATAPGTWSLSTSVIYAIYRGVDTTAPIGAHIAGSSGGGGSMTYPALTLTDNDGSSWVVGFAGHRSSDTALENPPAGMSVRATVQDATDEAALHDTNGGVTSWSATSVTIGGTTSTGRVHSIELLAATGGGGSATGSLAATESGSDTASLAGDVLIDGALAAAESGADTAAIAGDVIVSGALAASESGSDTAAFAGDASSAAFGTLAATETGSDTASLAGVVRVSGSLAASESGADVAAFAGTAAGPITGTLAATEEGSDSATFRAPVRDEPQAVGGYWWPQDRRRTKDEIDAERRRLGILPPEVAAVVKEVARQEVAKPASPAKAEIRRDFKRELTEAKAEYRTEYLKALYAEIEHQRLLEQQAQEEEEEAVAVLLMALAA